MTELYGHYSTTNWHGQDTTVHNVVDYVSTDEETYKGTTVFHAGHFSAIGRAYQSYNGTPINDTYIYPETSLGKHFFVFLWVCVQAQVPIDNSTNTVRPFDESVPANAPGTPIAWTHRDGTTGHTYMSADGYSDPEPTTSTITQAHIYQCMSIANLQGIPTVGAPYLCSFRKGLI